ncbi:major facilitator superfamily domain-containing protein, partial [Bisporella sp. PMI_857]
FLTYALGTFSGGTTDAGYFKPTMILASLVTLIGIFTASISTRYWQIFLAQGLCQGIGNGLPFTPAMAVLSTYFAKNRSWAVGIAAWGNATGGMIFPAIFNKLLPSIGFAWTVRVIGLVMLISQVIAVYALRPLIPPHQGTIGSIVDWPAFKEMPYTLFIASYFSVMWGVYLPHYYISIYFHCNLHSSQFDSFNILILLNGVGIAGRVVASFFANKFTGSLNLLLVYNLISAILIYCWIAIKYSRGFYAFSVLY